MHSRRANPNVFALFLVLSIAFALSASAGERVHFTPKYSSGESLSYSIESRTTNTGKTTTPIVNPEGGSQSTQIIHMVVRLDVLDVSTVGDVRMRATYEKSSATSESDTLDLEASSFVDQYNRLENHSFEFTIGPGGQITGLASADAKPPAQPFTAPALTWLQGLSSSGGFPQKGVQIGEKWKSERALAGVVLSGLIWRTESTYLRNEPCEVTGGSRVSGSQSSQPEGECAVILTRFEILRRGSDDSDATPEDYRRNGLRTLGKWTGSGESLDSISLTTGLLVSSTQTSTQNMDYKIVSATTGSTIHRVGKVESQSEIALLPAEPVAQP